MSIQVTVSNPLEWTPLTNYAEIVVSNRRLRPSPGFSYQVNGLVEDAHYRVFLKVEMVDNHKYKMNRERKMWLPHSNADQKDPIFMEHEDGLQSGKVWNEKGADFRNVFFSTKNHKNGNMTVDSLRRYKASVLIEDCHGECIEFDDPRQTFVTKSPAPSKRKATKEEEITEPAAKKTKEIPRQYTQSREYFDWQYDCRPGNQERQIAAEEAKENVQPTEWIQKASESLLEDQRELLSDFFCFRVAAPPHSCLFSCTSLFPRSL
uniref:T-box domain-containing protein n=1 Tax=Caenorhabditis tropicalis TaxID=1561998 RepID=A0A1I7T606_9PELO